MGVPTSDLRVREIVIRFEYLACPRQGRLLAAAGVLGHPGCQIVAVEVSVDQSFVRQTLIDRMRRHGESLEQAASSFVQRMGVPMSEVGPVIESIRREGSGTCSWIRR